MRYIDAPVWRDGNKTNDNASTDDTLDASDYGYLQNSQNPETMNACVRLISMTRPASVGYPEKASPMTGNRRPLALVVTAGVAILALAGPALAQIRVFSIMELAEQSDLVILGTVSHVGTERAQVRIETVLLGKLDAPSVSVAPIYLQLCVRQKLNFIAGEDVLIFGKHAGDNLVTVVAGGQGKIGIAPKAKEGLVEAVKRLLGIAALKDEHARNVAMLAHVKDENEVLRRESLHYITLKIASSKLRQRYKDDLVALLKDADPDVQLAGLHGIRFVDAKDTIPRLIELSRNVHKEVASAAGLALALYDTAESVAALVALTESEDPELRMRASIDLRRSSRPEAKETMKRLLEDADARVRATALQGFVYWLRRGQVKEVLPKLISMLADPVGKVRAAAANTLGECRDAKAVPPLLGLLERDAVEPEVEAAVLGALRGQYGRGGAEARALVDNKIGLIVAALKRGKDDSGPSLSAVGILNLSSKPEAKEGLRWAAASHPKEWIRELAKRSLGEIRAYP